MTFKDWLKKYEGKNSPRGDLAYDVSHDKSFPTGNNYLVVLNHLQAGNACSEAIRTFQRAWKSYEKDIKDE